MNQLSINFDAPPLAQARAVGEAASQLALQRAERETPSFGARAEAAILKRLEQGQASGEDLTDYVREQGVPFADGRALGGVFARLRRTGLIRVVGTCNRRRGHGTAGGLIWERC